MAMKHQITPVTIFTPTVEEAITMASQDPDSRAMTTGAGTLSFHQLIAEHGAGQFRTLFCPASLRGTWRTPIGGEVKIIKK